MSGAVAQPSADDLLAANEVAELLAVSTCTLANWRALQKGPPFIRIGRRLVRYRRTDLEAFIAGGAA